MVVGKNPTRARSCSVGCAAQLEPMCLSKILCRTEKKDSLLSYIWKGSKGSIACKDLFHLICGENERLEHVPVDYNCGLFKYNIQNDPLG